MSYKNKIDIITEKSFQKKPFYACDIAENNAEKNSKECISREVIMSSNPVRVRIDLTNKCNLNCIFCYRRHFEIKNMKALITPDDIELLSPVLNTAKYISLFRNSEPLISPHIIPILDKISAFNSIVSLSTNGQLLNNDVSWALVRNNITFITISCCAFDDDHYRKLHGGGSYKTLLENINLLNLIKKEYNKEIPRLRLSFMLRMDTIDYLDDALEFVKKYNFSEGIQVLLFYRAQEDDKHLEPIFNWDYCKPILDDFKEKARKKNIMLDLSYEVPDNWRPLDTEGAVSLCYEPFETFTVTPNGDVVPCTVSGTLAGNIRFEDPLSIWNNYKYQEFRRRMKDKPLNKDCMGCWHSRYVSPLTHGNKLVKAETIFDNFYRKQ